MSTILTKLSLDIQFITEKAILEFIYSVPFKSAFFLPWFFSSYLPVTVSLCGSACCMDRRARENHYRVASGMDHLKVPV